MTQIEINEGFRRHWISWKIQIKMSSYGTSRYGKVHVVIVFSAKYQ